MKRNFGISIILFVAILILWLMNPNIACAMEVYSTASIAGEDSVFQFSLNVAGSSRFLVVAITDEQGDSALTVSYAGQPLSRDTALAYNSDKPRAEVWHLINPPLGSDMVSVSFGDGNKTKATIGAVTYTGVNQTTPNDGLVCDSGKSTSPHLNLPSDTGDLVQDVMVSKSNGVPTVNSGQSILWNLEMGGVGKTNHYGAASNMPGQKNANLVWHLQESKKWVMIGFNINRKPNSPPIFNAVDSQVVTEGNILSLTLSATDPDSTIPVLTAVNLPTNSSFADNGDGTGHFSFNPDFSQAGVYNVSFIASDGALADTMIVIITVANLNHSPVLNPIGTKSIEIGVSLHFNISAQDPDGTTPALTAINLPSNATFVDQGNRSGVFDFTPDVSQGGIHFVTFVASDGVLADSEIVSISVVDLSTLSYVRIEYKNGAPIGNMTLTADNDTTEFYCRGYTSSGSLIGDVSVTWSVISADLIGTVLAGPDAFTLLTLTKTGTGKIVGAYSVGIGDTTGTITCLAGELARLDINPDSIDLRIGDTVRFTASGYDSDGNSADEGTLSWRLRGRVGQIDNLALLTADHPGRAYVIVSSDINGVSDTTQWLSVDELYLSTISLGNNKAWPGQWGDLSLAFRIDNYFDVAKSIDGISLRQATRGPGTILQRLSNIDSVALWLDLNNDSLLTGSDSLIRKALFKTNQNSLYFPAIALPAAAGKTFFVNFRTSLYPHDGDSVDLYILPAVDISTTDGTIVKGPDSANSHGYCIVDGMTSNQVQMISAGVESLLPGGELQHILTIDIPQNGYMDDTLMSFSLVNSGSAVGADIDTIQLFADAGDGQWKGKTVEKLLGDLEYTGRDWKISGLDEILHGTSNRFFIGVKSSRYLTGSRTIAFQIPIGGIEVASGNDGPIDDPIGPADTIIIQTNSQFQVSVINLQVKDLIPGNISCPLLRLALDNGLSSIVNFDSVIFSSVAYDPGGASQKNLDSQIDSLILYIDRDGIDTLLGSSDLILGTARISNGKAKFKTPGVTVLGQGGALNLSIAAALNLRHSRNGNTLSIQLKSPNDIYLSPATEIAANFPLKNDSNFVINAFPASAVTVYPVEGKSLFNGVVDQVVLDIRLFGNGYSPDALKRIRIENKGSLNPSLLLGTLRLWEDKTGNGFTTDDRLISSFSYISSSWQIDNLHLNLDTLGSRYLVTLDIANTQFEGGTFLPSIPVDGLEYASGTIGPDDASIDNTDYFLIFPANRITAISIPMQSDTIPPGTRAQMLLAFAIYNGYADQNTAFQGIAFSNASQSYSTPAFADSELGQVSLYFDVDNDRLWGADSLIGTGYFSNGRLQIFGFDALLSVRTLSYFFLTADISTDAIDGDIVAASINSFSDFQFSQEVNIDGDMPLSRGGIIMLDGSIGEQYESLSLSPRTVSPGDSSITLLAFKPAVNGNLADYLTGLIIENKLDADTAEIAKMELWQDKNADGVWQSTDLYISDLNYSNGVWSVDNLGIRITDNDRPLLFINADFSLTARPNTRVQAQIPVNGCQFSSSNDGPYDAPVESDGIISISGSGIKISMSPLKASYTVGQTIAVGFLVTNLHADSINGVLGELVNSAGTASARVDSAQTGPVQLGPGESEIFTIYLTAIQPGYIGWIIRVSYTTQQDSTPLVQTAMTNIQVPPPDAIVRLTSSMPTGVIRGQTNIFPLSLDLINPGTPGMNASISIDSLRLMVTNEFMEPQAAAAVFSRLVILTGYSVLAVIDTMPANPNISFVFEEPVIIAPGHDRRLTVLADVDSTAEANSFAFAILDTAAIILYDINTNNPVAMDSSVQYPIRTASCQITDPSCNLWVSEVASFSGNLNKGQQDAELLRLGLRHPGNLQSSPIQLTGLSICVVNDAQEIIAPYGLLDAIEVCRGSFPLARIVGNDLNSIPLKISLNSPLTIGPGQLDTIDVRIAVSAEPTLPSFKLMVPDSTSFTLRDLNSGSLLFAATDTSQWSTGSIFPISSGTIIFKSPAMSPEVCLYNSLSSTIVAGMDSVEIGRISISYPFGSNISPIHVSAVKTAMIDTSGKPINSDLLFDRIGYKVNSQSVNYQDYIEFASGSALFRLGDSGIILRPGDSAIIQLVADIEPDAPVSHFSLIVESGNSIIFKDATDSTNTPAPTLSMNCTSSFPFVFGPARVLFPAGRPSYTSVPLAPIMAFPSQPDISIFEGALQYGSVAPVGDLVIRSLSGRVFKRIGQDYIPINSGAVFSAVYLSLNGVRLAVDTVLSNDSIFLQLPGGFAVPQGSAVSLSLKCDINNDVALGNYLIQFADSTFIDIADKFLDSKVFPSIGNMTYPLTSSEIAVSSAELGASFTNYPNPFIPSRGEKTRIGYVLEEDAHVDIQVYSITGDYIDNIIIQAFKGAGPHQEETWDGTNSAGQNVASGTYFCRITAKYISGRIESHKRKISVIR